MSSPNPDASGAAPHCCHSLGKAARSVSTTRTSAFGRTRAQAVVRLVRRAPAPRLDHRVLDPEQPPPYPRCALAVPILIVSDCGRPETLDRTRRVPLLIMKRYPRERQ